MSNIIRYGSKYVAQLEFDADELRNIAYSLGLNDMGAQEMLTVADEVDRHNGVEVSE